LLPRQKGIGSDPFGPSLRDRSSSDHCFKPFFKAFFLKFLLQCFLPDHSCGQESARSDNIRLDFNGFIDCSASLKNFSLLIIPSPVV
jgi:hypothetical protein